MRFRPLAAGARFECRLGWKINRCKLPFPIQAQASSLSTSEEFLILASPPRASESARAWGFRFQHGSFKITGDRSQWKANWKREQPFLSPFRGKGLWILYTLNQRRQRSRDKTLP